jgi:hypothetical protein
MHGGTFGLPANQDLRLTIKLGPIWLATGKFFLYFWLIKPWKQSYHAVELPLIFEIIHSDPYNVGFDFKQSYRRGPVGLPLQYQLCGSWGQFSSKLKYDKD